MPRWLLLACVTTFVGCRSAGDESPSATDIELIRWQDPIAFEFPGARRLDLGFDAPDPSGTWRVGDRVVYGVRVDDEHGHEAWLVELEVLTGVLRSGAEVRIPPSRVEVREGVHVPPERHLRAEARRFRFKLPEGYRRSPESRPILLAVHAYDADGTYRGTSHATASADDLAAGFHHLCERWTQVASLRPEEVDALSQLLLRGMSSLLGLLQTLQEHPALAPVLDALRSRVIDLPSGLSVVLSSLFGPRPGVSILPAFSRAIPVDRPPAFAGDAGTWRFPTDVWFQGDLLLRYDTTSVPSVPPFHLTAGIIGVEGRHPTEPHRRFQVRLLAARRGPEARGISPESGRLAFEEAEPPR